MSETQSKNEVAWKKLFDQHDIVNQVDNHGVFRISASVINKEREARLMTKLDHIVNLPKIFKANQLAILPDSRGTYVIGRFECYQKVPTFDASDIEDATLPLLETLSAEDIYSEVATLLCAHHAGLISDVLKESVDLTVFGRMSTGKFDFSVFDKSIEGPRHIAVSNSQCEIDGGYEGEHLFAILEAKNQMVEDFNIRQLYYPFRLWKSKISKPVVPVFVTYSNEVFSFFVYQFTDEANYNSLELIRTKHYRIAPTEINIADIRHILGQTQVQPEPVGIPFPQADSFERVIDLLSNLQNVKGTLGREEITTNYAFDVRQTQYYTDAARYLGLIDKNRDSEQGVTYYLTDAGSKLMRKSAKARNLSLIGIILSRSAFRETMNAFLKTGAVPPISLVEAEIVKTQPLNPTTAHRRAQTVLGWVRWIASLTKEA